MREPTTPPGPEPATAEASALVARARAGDESAWADLVARYARRVYALARSRSLGPDLAEEVTQSVFVTVAEQFDAGAYREAGRFEPWLFRIAMNRLRDAVRAERRRARALDGAARSLRDGPHPPPDADERQRLRRALSDLPEKDREVVTLRHHAGLEFKRIADLLGEPIGTVLARHHRALNKLRDMLEEDEP